MWNFAEWIIFTEHRCTEKALLSRSERALEAAPDQLLQLIKYVKRSTNKPIQIFNRPVLTTLELTGEVLTAQPWT